MANRATRKLLSERALPRPDFNQTRVLGYPTRVRPGRVHLVNCTEMEAPGIFEIRCSCGETSWTPWGEAHAGEIAELHLWIVKAPTKHRVRIHR